jgi:hypothetical protein
LRLARKICRKRLPLGLALAIEAKAALGAIGTQLRLVQSGRVNGLASQSRGAEIVRDGGKLGGC